MKNYFKYFIPTMLLSALSVNLYAQTVYLAEANRTPFKRTVFLNDGGETLRYTAFYKGNSAPQGDITVNFSVDTVKAAIYNAQHGTEYKMLPKESYSIGMNTAVIAQGSVSATPGEVKVTGKGYLKTSEKYILPVTVSVKGNLAEVEPSLSTIYYLITVVPNPGNVPRKQIGRLPSGTQSVFGFGDKYLIADGGNGELTRYRYTSSSLDEAIPMSVPDNLKEMTLLFNFRDHHIIGLYPNVANGQLWSFPISADEKSVETLDKVFGTAGYNILSDICPIGTNLYCRKPNGELLLYSLTESLEWATLGSHSLGSGWNHPMIFGYGNSLIAIDKEGVMWSYPVLKNGQLGWVTKIGTGWNLYDKIAVVGNDLLCVDKEGIVWQIQFNDEGFWIH